MAETTLAYRQRTADYFRDFMGDGPTSGWELWLMNEDAPITVTVVPNDIEQPDYIGYQPITVTVADMPSPSLESEGYSIVIGGPGKTFAEPPSPWPIYGWALVDVIANEVLLYEKFPQPVNTGPGQPITISVTWRIGNCP